MHVSVADPGFPRGGGVNSPGGRQHTILPNFSKNCMKLKEFGPPGGGGRASKILLCRSATVYVHIKHIILKYVTVTPQYSVMTYFSFLETSTLSSYNADSNMLPFNSFVLLVCMSLTCHILTSTCCRHKCFGVFSIYTLADIEVLINIL